MKYLYYYIYRCFLLPMCVMYLVTYVNQYKTRELSMGEIQDILNLRKEGAS